MQYTAPQRNRKKEEEEEEEEEEEGKWKFHTKARLIWNWRTPAAMTKVAERE